VSRRGTQAQRGAAPLVRFDAVQRAAHWTTSALFFCLLATAIPLYFGSLFGTVLNRHTVEEIHLWSGLALPVPLLVAALGSWGGRTRRDLRRFIYWSRDESAWLRTMGRARFRTGKFNPGQKLNAVVLGGLFVVLLCTGAMLRWFEYFPVSTRTAATFVHDSFALAATIVVAGHVAMALAHPTALRSMFSGSVPERWASERAPSWLDEVSARDS